MNMKQTLLAIAVSTLMGSAFAGISPPYDLYTCGGATFANGYDVDVDLDNGYEGVWFQLEDSATGDCDDAKDAGADFACNQKGSGNLVTSKIDDDTSPVDGPSLYSESSDNADLDMTDAGADPRYAIVHADIFIPGSCATNEGPCDHDGDSGELTAEWPSCYYSGHDGGDFNGIFNNPEDSCDDAANNETTGTAEGMFAEANGGGGTISPNRPKGGNKAHKNWAMYVELTAACQSGYLAVEAGAAAPTCDEVSVERTAVADGGDWETDFVDAGDVKFTPDTQCTATLECEDSSSDTECVPISE